MNESNSRFSNKEPPAPPKKFGRLFGGKGRIIPKKFGCFAGKRGVKTASQKSGGGAGDGVWPPLWCVVAGGRTKTGTGAPFETRLRVSGMKRGIGTPFEVG